MKYITNALIILITAIFGFVGLIWVYVAVFIDTPKTGSFEYVYTLTDHNGEERYFLELNHFSGIAGGEPLTELIFSYYTDFRMQAVKQYGIQKRGDTFYYYDGFNGSYVSIPPKAAGYRFIVDIMSESDIAVGALRGDPYAVILDGTYRERTEHFNLFKPVENLMRSTWGTVSDLFRRREDRNQWRFDADGQHMWEGGAFNDVTYLEKPYTIEDFFNMAMLYLTRSCYGFGEYVLPLVELQSYFSLEKFENGQFIPSADYDFNISYFAVRVNHYRYGASFASQSAFGMIANDPHYNGSGIDVNDEYWKYSVNHTLTARDFNYTYSAALGGHLLSVSPLRLAQLAAFNNMTVSVSLDLNDVWLMQNGINLIGIDLYGLFGLRLTGLSITGTGNQDFYLLQGSLWDTGLTGIQATGVSLIKSNGYINGGAV